jgi:Ser/Thr protein kinase RdoA (MazF antagonist)
MPGGLARCYGELRVELETSIAQAKGSRLRAERWQQRLSEASTMIYLIGSRPVQDAADAQVKMLVEFLGTLSAEGRSWTREKLQAMRDELWERWRDTAEDFQRAIAEELRMEPRRALRRRRAR